MIYHLKNQNRLMRLNKLNYFKLNKYLKMIWIYRPDNNLRMIVNLQHKQQKIFKIYNIQNKIVILNILINITFQQKKLNQQKLLLQIFKIIQE